MRRNNRRCYHRNRKVIEWFRKNYPFGRKSKAYYYGIPKKCIEVCDDCHTILNKWKPEIK